MLGSGRQDTSLNAKKLNFCDAEQYQHVATVVLLFYFVLCCVCQNKNQGLRLVEMGHSYWSSESHSILPFEENPCRCFHWDDILACGLWKWQFTVIFRGHARTFPILQALLAQSYHYIPLCRISFGQALIWIAMANPVKDGSIDITRSSSQKCVF